MFLFFKPSTATFFPPRRVEAFTCKSSTAAIKHSSGAFGHDKSANYDKARGENKNNGNY